MNTHLVFVTILALSSMPVFAQSTPFPKVVSPLGNPTNTPWVMPIITGPPPQTLKDQKKKKDPQPPPMPQMPGGGGGGAGNQSGQQKPGSYGAGPSGGSQSEGKAKEARPAAESTSVDGDGLCTPVNQAKVQHKENGCRAHDTALENGCAHDKLNEVVKKAGADGKGLSDLEKYCPNYSRLPDTKKQEVYKQLIAASIHETSHWSPNSGLMNIRQKDVQSNQDCHGIDATNKADNAKNLKCGSCVVLTKIAQGGKLADGLDGAASQNVAKVLKSFCENAAKGGPANGQPSGADPNAIH